MLGAILAGASVIGNLITGKKNRDDAREANKRNLAFQREMWEKTNAYNAPVEQRKRMEAAGFNPNLMYGNGTVVNTAQNQNMPDQRTLPPQPDYVGGAVSIAQQIQQMKMMEKQGQAIDADIILKSAQTAGVGADNALKNRTLDTAVESAREALTKLRNENTGVVQDNIRKAAENETIDERMKLQVEEAKERIKAIKVGTDKAEIEKIILEEERKLRQAGIENAPWWIRQLVKENSYVNRAMRSLFN